MLKDNVQVNINISVQIFEVNVDLPAFLQTIQGWKLTVVIKSYIRCTTFISIHTEVCPIQLPVTMLVTVIIVFFTFLFPVQKFFHLAPHSFITSDTSGLEVHK